MRFSPFLKENIRTSLASIKSNKLRSILTISIIVIGMIALIGIITATESVKYSVTSSYTSMGANLFTMSKERYSSTKKSKNRRPARITLDQAVAFKKKYKVPAVVAISTQVSYNAIVKNGSLKTNPTVSVVGVDDNAVVIETLEMQLGRNFTSTESEMGRSVALIGADIKNTLFPLENPIGKNISIAGKNFNVVGLLKPKGSSFGRSQDLRVLVPFTAASAVFGINEPTYSIKTQPYNSQAMESAIVEAEGLLRVIRGLRVSEPTDFSIVKSDAMLERLSADMFHLLLVGIIIGSITILGASVGLMNIMLVSVNEKTREIGIRKSLGAKSVDIKQQFLIESILISQMGGVLGIIIGVSAGNLISIITETPFFVPWNWALMGFVLCSVVGIISGYMPAVKASKLDPIEALRYE